MKDKKIKKLMSYANEDYVKEAEPEAKVKKKAKAKPLWLRPAALAASFVLLFSAVGITLFATLGKSDYKDSAYYPVIAEITAYQKAQEAKKPSFLESLLDHLKAGSAASGDDSAPSYAPGDPGDTANGAVEITDHQVAGVKEANRIARTDTHIFYLDGSVLRAYTIAGTESAEVGTFPLSRPNVRYAKLAQTEFFLSADGKTVTLICPYTGTDGKNHVDLLTVDVSDPAAMCGISHVTVSGSYLTVRSVGTDIFLMTEYRPDEKINFGKEETFLPGITGEDGFSPVTPDNVLLPKDGITSLAYTVVTRLSAAGGEPEIAAFLSYSDEIYVSATRIYATRAEYVTTDLDNGGKERVLQSEIARIRYADGAMVPEPSLSVEGEIENRFCLDEADGILRVVTTVDRALYASYDATGAYGKNASLFCFSLADGTVVAKVERFAQRGESVRSARFDGDRLYVCTSVENTDPVFLFDLSDLSAITVKDTGTIAGFSTSLITFGDALLGIGEGANRGSLKIEVYEETKTGIRSLSSYTTENTSYAKEYKAYAIDRAASVLGLGTQCYGETDYLVFYFDGSDLYLAEKIPLEGDPETQRGCLVGDWFYAFGASDFAVRQIFGK
ncbi:MAG TPA: hypothetical protein DDY70_00700 [Clostridiales bacterium]|nr:hypothetical protein [Clostridiales bacterium]